MEPGLAVGASWNDEGTALSQFDAVARLAGKFTPQLSCDFRRSAKMNPKCFPNRAEQGRFLG
jgi:hypothetical protein